ncbi:proline-rich receptor-like protein kinase PERK10 [Corapipo altera]|uniref:proline-rich receptor-like protein kinase PERK10 n=1 Tax=Corapipo altera TaxID=415028 RepID=UPI000FD6B69F|nr:proline-rich receptor-like protein kinase PERK10 [Corapipo altera]
MPPDRGTPGTLFLLVPLFLLLFVSPGFQEEEPPGNRSVTRQDVTLETTGDPLETTGDPLDTTGPTTTPRDVPTPRTWPTDPPSPPWTPVPSRATSNQTQSSSGVPVRYWSPVIFVVVALLVLFFTYHRKKGEGSRDQAVAGSDSSDLGVLDHPPAHDTTPIITAPQGERKGPETPPAADDTETAFCEPDPPQPQPDSPPAAGGSGDPDTD